MVIKTALNSITDTTAHTSTLMAESENFSQDRERKLPFAQKQAMQCLCGADSSMEAANAVLTAPYSETKATTDPATSYAKRMRLLMKSGLVAGITPTSVRNGSNQGTLDFAFYPQVGEGSSGEQDQGCEFWSASDE